MLGLNLPCFLLVPNSQNKRILLPGTVSQLEGSTVCVSFDAPVAPQVGDDVTLLAEWRGKFFQQAAKILARQDLEGVPNVQFERIGEPVSAESRGIYRVSVAIAELYARVDKQPRCHIVDISPEGFAVICPNPLTVGTSVLVGFEMEGIKIEGSFRVQTAKETKAGKKRFGLLAPDAKSPVRNALQRLSMQLQRQQLKRLAGAA